MQIENRFTLATSPDRSLDLLLDVERIVPCMPGAELQGRDGDGYKGAMKVKVGPITAQYTGTVEFVEVDRDAGRVVMRASGRELRGQGTAEAAVVARVQARDGHSVVELTTDLSLRGRLAQFGRGVLADVSQGIVDQFARNLQERLGAENRAIAIEGSPVAIDAAVGALAQSPRRRDSSAEPALSVPLWPVAKRVVPALVAIAAVVLVARRLI